MKSIRKFSPEKVPFPRGWEEFSSESFFSQDREIIIEIGCGTGLYLIQQAEKNQSFFYIGIEHTNTRYQKFINKYYALQKLLNLLPVQAHAVEWIVHFVPLEKVSQYILFYPNPNPKRVSQRWYAMPFMQYLIKTLKIGGTILITTNEFFYYKEAKEYLACYQELKKIEDYIIPHHQVGRTQFEIKFLSRLETCYELKYLRSSYSSPLHL